MAYVKQEWKNLPNQTTPVNATRMNHIEDGIYDNSVEISNIIESGSNSNGNWIKYSDGTMIEYGINYGVNDNYRLITYPIEFKTIPIVLSTVNAYAEGYIYNSQIYDFNTENCKAVVFYATINGAWNKGSNQFSWLAIGKWK